MPQLIPQTQREKRACLYLRVSTTSRTNRQNGSTFDQDPAVQEQPLRELIAQRGWTLHHIYSDRARWHTRALCQCAVCAGVVRHIGTRI